MPAAPDGAPAVTDLDTRARRGSHRARRNRTAFLLGLLALVVVVVVAAVVGLAVIPNDDEVATTTTTATPAATASPSGSPVPSPAAPSPGATPTVRPSTPAASTPVTSPSTAASVAPPGKPTIDGTPVPDPGGDLKAATSIVVLNQTRISGLANQAANALRDAGWTVVGLGNFSGSVPSTTVYYPTGQEAAATAVAADLPGPDRTRPRFGNLSGSRLTVVLTGAIG